MVSAVSSSPSPVLAKMSRECIPGAKSLSVMTNELFASPKSESVTLATFKS